MDFYTVDANYVNYLKEYEISRRGFSRVPNVEYKTNKKFMFGSVLEVNDMLYYVPISSYKKNHFNNIVIHTNDEKNPNKGSLRFSYMIPVPSSCLYRLNINSIEDTSYRSLLNKELSFCIKNDERIRRKAKKIYDMVTADVNPLLTENSCDFKLLEEACQEYKKSPKCNRG